MTSLFMDFLNWINSWVGNYGWSVVVFTLFVRLVLLPLDDVMSELDPGRRRQLVSRLQGVQTFITCTDEDDLAGAEVGRAWRVDNGRMLPL